MADGAGLEGRIKTLEGDVRKLTADLATEQKDRIKADQDLEQQMQLLGNLLADNNAAGGYVVQYVNRLDAQYNDKQLMLQESIQNFNEFLKLPEKSNNYFAMWEAAWQVLSVAVPAFRLSAVFASMEKAAKIEMASAKAFQKVPALMARRATAIAKGHEIADVLRKANSIPGKLKDAMSGVSERHAADNTKTPIRDLIAESHQAHKAVDQAVETLDDEFKARLDSLLYKVPYQTKGTMLDMAKRLLPPITYYSDDELDQIGRFFLWNTLAAYAQQNVQIVKTQYRTGDSISIRGLNDNQQDQIMAWFGLRSNWHGGRVPVMQTIWMALTFWGVKWVHESTGASIFGYG